MTKLVPLSLLFLCSCGANSYLLNRVPYEAARPLNAKRIVLTSGYDVSREEYREAKTAQFELLIQHVLRQMADRFAQAGVPTVLVPGRAVDIARADSSVQALQKQYESSHVIYISRLNVYFDQTDVEVTKTESGKEREAFYDIRADVTYNLAGNREPITSETTAVSKFHSSRSVLSGLLAAGPSIVSNNDDAMAILNQNVKQYLRPYLPGEDTFSRKLFTDKEFSGLREMIDRDDLAGARLLCEHQLENPNSRVAARANYNLAVLAERQGDKGAIIQYLRESVRILLIPEAEQMLMHYQDR